MLAPTLNDEEAKKPYIESFNRSEFSQISSTWRSAETAQLYLISPQNSSHLGYRYARPGASHSQTGGAARRVVATDANAPRTS